MSSRRLWLHQLRHAGACRSGRDKFIDSTLIYTKVRTDPKYIQWAIRQVSDGELLWLARNLLSHEALQTYFNYRWEQLKFFRKWMQEVDPNFDDHRSYMFDLVWKFADLYIADGKKEPKSADVPALS